MNISKFVNRTTTGIAKNSQRVGLFWIRLPSEDICRLLTSRAGKRRGSGALVPQGIQGDDCSTFSAWMSSCQRSDSHHDNLRLTEPAPFASQVEVSESFRSTTQQGTDKPSSQGVQGENCAYHHLWMASCLQMDPWRCTEPLPSGRPGEKTLLQVFAEQETLIATVSYQYHCKKMYSTQTQFRPVLSSRGPSGCAASVRWASSVPPQPDLQTTPASEVSLNQRQKLQRAVKEYGGTVVMFHVTISLISLGGFYAAVSSGLDVVGLLTALGVGEQILQSKLATGTSTFVLAYAVHKVFAPVRIAITLTATPFIVRYLRRIGFLKTKPAKAP